MYACLMVSETKNIKYNLNSKTIKITYKDIFI